MNGSQDPEEIAALAVLDSLGRHQGPDETSVPEPEDEIEEVLRRLHTEAIGRLPYALPDARPDPAIREGLLRLVRADETQEVEPVVRRSETPAQPDQAAWSAAAAVAALGPGPSTGRDPVAGLRYAGARRSRRRWLAPLAAAAAVMAIVGLGLWVAYLQSELAASETRLAWGEKQWKGELAQEHRQLSEIEDRYRLVTSPAVTVFPLTAVSGTGPLAMATARLYVGPDHQRWMFDVHNLRAEPAGRDYQIWFLTDEGQKSAACFNMQGSQPVFKMVSPMPRDVVGVAVTLEPKGGSPYPTTPVLLVNKEPVRL